MLEVWLTWYLVNRVLHTPVSNIIATRKGTKLWGAIVTIVTNACRYCCLSAEWMQQLLVERMNEGRMKRDDERRKMTKYLSNGEEAISGGSSAAPL